MLVVVLVRRRRSIIYTHNVVVVFGWRCWYEWLAAVFALLREAERVWMCWSVD